MRRRSLGDGKRELVCSGESLCMPSPKSRFVVPVVVDWQGMLRGKVYCCISRVDVLMVTAAEGE